MGNHIARTLGALAFVLCFSLPAAAKQVALVVGINAYEKLKPSGQLQTAVNDSRAMARTLRELRFEVIEANELDRKGFNQAWDRFLGRIEPGDTAVFFYAGHGVQIDNQNFLLPNDVPKPQSGRWELLKRESLSVAEFLKDLHAKGARLSLIILDACRDSPFGELSRGVGMARGLADVEPPRGTFLMFSAAAGQTALDSLGGDERETNSVYTRKLVPLMKLKGLTIRDLALRVRREVNQLAKTVGHDQWPAYRDELDGTSDYCLAGCEVATGSPSGGGTSPSGGRAVRGSMPTVSVVAAGREGCSQYAAKVAPQSVAALLTSKGYVVEPVGEFRVVVSCSYRDRLSAASGLTGLAATVELTASRVTDGARFAELSLEAEGFVERQSASDSLATDGRIAQAVQRAIVALGERIDVSGRAQARP